MTPKQPAPGKKERKSAESTKKLLEDFGGKIVKDIDALKSPTFKTAARTRSNIHYDQKEGVLTLGRNQEERSFINIAQSKRFMQTVAVAAKCHKFVTENLHTSIRGLFYQLKYSLGEDVEENVFSEQAESNPLIEDLETSLGVKREDLNLNANRKGVLAGNMKVIDRFGGDEIETDTSKMGRSGWAIPSDVDNDIEFVDLKARYVLCLPSFEKIVVLEKGKPKIVKISDVVDGQHDGIDVLSFDEGHKVCKNNVVSVHKRASYPGEKLVKITSKSGSVIHVSEDHKIPVMRDGEIKIIAAKTLSEEDFLIEAKKINCLHDDNSAERIDVIEILSRHADADQVMVAGASDLIGDPREMSKQLGLFISKRSGKKSYTYPYTYIVSGWKERDSIPLRYYLKMETDRSLREKVKVFFKGAKRKNLIPAFITVDEDFCKLLGYYLAEGHIYRNSIGFSLGSHETNYHKEIRSLARNIFGIDISSYSHKGETQLFIQNKAVSHLFKGLGLATGSHAKKVPSFVYTLSKSCIKALLDGYLNGDGYRNTFDTVSEDLQLGMNLLLRILGVPTYKEVRDNSRGFASHKTATIHHTAFIESYFDKIPKEGTPHHLWERYPLALVAGERSRQVFEPYFANSYRTITRARLTQSKNENVGKWLEADIHPVMIRKIEYLDYSGPMYDLVSVVPTHVFMHASGIFSHNCVEKDALWQRLNEDGFWKKENCILMSPQGQAARGARRIIRKFADEGLPVYTFNDADAWGWYIHWTIKTGSMNLAYMGKEIATPEAHFLGVTMSDLEEFEFLKKSALKATEIDLKRAQEMLAYPWINRHKEWADELKKVLKLKLKLEQDALQGPRLTFVGEYVKQKIKNEEWLP